MKKFLAFLLVVVLLFSIPAAQAKTYKAKKVTAKQIATELKKTTGLIKSISKADVEASLYQTPNNFKTKYNFTDKKYKDVYCTIEVYRDNYDAIRRQGQMDLVKFFSLLFDMGGDMPTESYRYKNVIIMLNSKIPLSRAVKYYNALKKIIK